MTPDPDPGARDQREAEGSNDSPSQRAQEERGGRLRSQGTSLARRTVTAVSATSAGSVVVMAATALANVIVARSTGTSGYAEFVVANMIIYVGAMVVTLGAPLSLAKRAAVLDENGKYDELATACTSLVWALAGLGAAGGILLALGLPTVERLGAVLGEPTFLWTLPFAVTLATTAMVAQATYTGLLETRITFTIAAIGPLTMVGYLLLRRLGPPLPVWGAVTSSYGLSGLAGLAFLLHDGLARPRLPRMSALRSLRRDLLPSGAYTYFRTFSAWSDRAVTGTVLGATPMSFYNAAIVVIQAAMRIPLAIGTLLVPTARRVESDDRRASRLHREVMKSFSLFAAALTVTLVLASHTVVLLLFGPGFVTETAPALQMMSLSLLAAAVSIPYVSAITGATENRGVFALIAYSLVPRIALLVTMTAIWGLMGTAVATLVSELLLAVVAVILGRRIGIPSPLRDIKVAYAIALVALIVGSLARSAGASEVSAALLALVPFTPPAWRTAQSLREAYSA